MKEGTERIVIHDGFIHVEGIGRVGIWWKYADKRVTLSFGFGDSFFANTEEEVKEGIQRILDKKQ